MKAIEWYILTKNSGMRLGITGEITLMAETGNVTIFIKTFDGFDVYVNGKMVYFPAAKRKRCLQLWSKNAEAAFHYPR